MIVHRILSDGNITPLKKYAMGAWIATSGVGVGLPILLRSGTRVGRWLGKQDTIHLMMSGGIAASSAAYGAGLLATDGSVKDTIFAFCVTAGNAMTIAHKLMRIPDVNPAFKEAARAVTRRIKTRAAVYVSAIGLRAASYVPLAMIDKPRAAVAAAFGLGLYTIFRRAYLTRPRHFPPPQPSPPGPNGDRRAMPPPPPGP